jgi:hypothetical protein
MKKKSSEKAKPKARKLGFNLCAPGTARVSLAVDFNGCMLVIREVFGTYEHITLYQGRLPEYCL